MLTKLCRTCTKLWSAVELVIGRVWSNVLAAIVLLVCYSSPALAQSYLTQTGSPTFTSAWPVELGYVNVGNGNLHLAMPIDSLPERGSRPFVAALAYDSRIWQIVVGTSNT